MKLQLNSGQGPVECRLAVGGIAKELMKEYKGMKVLWSRKDYGHIPNAYSSILLECEDIDLTHLNGTIEWVCPSPIRKGHKRKNWFINSSTVEEVGGFDSGFLTTNLKFQYFHCGGHGGQNVNKVETGVRVTHIPTNITVECTEERTQYQNKAKALKKLEEEINKRIEDNVKSNNKSLWSNTHNFERGNPIRVYKGLDFKLKRK